MTDRKGDQFAVSHEQERADMLQYMDDLPKRLQQFSRRAAAFQPDERYSAEWFGQLGEWCRSLRISKDLRSTYFAAARTGIDVNTIRFWETGLAEPVELATIRDYVHTLTEGTHPYREFLDRFGIQEPQNPQIGPNIIR